ncbi:hypothetical protein ABVF61_27960 [Roseibium sp. HPY-6]|uniref:hypothetical protein n=1 Tax=Roseibium sp. HPY-6 TaxID=3229852 RepID=UPI00338F054F
MRGRTIRGYLISLAVASATIILTLNFVQPGGPGGINAAHLLIFGVVLLVTGALTIIPSIFLIMASERNAIRNPLFYVAFSSLLSIFVLPVISLRMDLQILTQSLVFLPGGIASGCTYWWFAGRKAGKRPEDLQKQINVFD